MCRPFSRPAAGRCRWKRLRRGRGGRSPPPPHPSGTTRAPRGVVSATVDPLCKRAPPCSDDGPPNRRAAAGCARDGVLLGTRGPCCGNTPRIAGRRRGAPGVRQGGCCWAPGGCRWTPGGGGRRSHVYFLFIGRRCSRGRSREYVELSQARTACSRGMQLVYRQLSTQSIYRSCWKNACR